MHFKVILKDRFLGVDLQRIARIVKSVKTPCDNHHRTVAFDVTEITFNVEPCAETGLLVASWDEPDRRHATQGKDLRELQDMVTGAVACHFGAREAPRSIRLHFTANPVATA